MAIRKPKFMRNDLLMQQYIEQARGIQNLIKTCKSLTDSQYVDLWDSWWFYIGRAAKAGGFFSMRAFRKWAKKSNTNLM